MLCAVYLTETRPKRGNRFGNVLVIGYVGVQNHPKGMVLS